jgi:hypothetical protein
MKRFAEAYWMALEHARAGSGGLALDASLSRAAYRLMSAIVRLAEAWARWRPTLPSAKARPVYLTTYVK